MTDAQVTVLSIAIVIAAIFLMGAIATRYDKSIDTDGCDVGSDIRDGAISILVELGKNELDATYIVDIVIEQNPDYDLQEVVNEALKR